MPRRMLGILLTLVILSRARGAEVAPLSVSTLKPERRDVVRWIRLPATMAADAEVTFYTKVSGFLKDFKADIGDRLTPGQIIGRLDAPEYMQDVKLAEAQLASAQADLATAQAQLASEQLGGEEITARQMTLQAELLKAKAEAERDQKEFARVQKLASKDAATEREREFQEGAAAIAAAGVAVAEKNLGALKPERDLWKKRVDSKAAAVEAARSKVAIAAAALERARIFYGYTTLKVPEIGVRTGRPIIVTQRFVNNGDLVSGGTGPRTGLQPILTLASTDPIRAITDVSENESPHVTTSTAVVITFYVDAHTSPVLARVSRSSNYLATNARTMRIEVDLPNSDGRIKPGMMANMELALETHAGALAVPASAVLVEKKGPSVFTIENGKAKQIPVTTGFTDHGMVELASRAVTAGTVLIKDVQAGIADGTPVTGK